MLGIWRWRGAGPGLVPTNPRTRSAPGGNACSRLGQRLRGFLGGEQRSNTIQDIGDRIRGRRGTSSVPLKASTNKQSFLSRTLVYLSEFCTTEKR